MRRAVLLCTRLAVSAVFAYLAVREARPSAVAAALGDAQLLWLWLVPVLTLLTVAFVLRAVRWWSLFSRAPSRSRPEPPPAAVGSALDAAGGKPKVAIVALLGGLDTAAARERLDAAGGVVRKALDR